jgi:hypothetical protein
MPTYSFGRSNGIGELLFALETIGRNGIFGSTFPVENGALLVASDAVHCRVV